MKCDNDESRKHQESQKEIFSYLKRVPFMKLHYYNSQTDMKKITANCYKLLRINLIPYLCIQ
jgi:hypothetical protein